MTTFSIEFRDAFVTSGKADASAGKAKGKALDIAIAMGFDFIPPSKGGKVSKEQWVELQSLVTLRFPTAAQSLLKIDPEQAKEKIAEDHEGCAYTPSGQPKNRRYWKQQIGSVISSYAKALKTRMIREAAGSNGANAKRSLETRVIEDASKLFKAVATCDIGDIPQDGKFDIEAVLDGLEIVIKKAGGRVPTFQ